MPLSPKRKGCCEHTYRSLIRGQSHTIFYGKTRSQPDTARRLLCSLINEAAFRLERTRKTGVPVSGSRVAELSRRVMCTDEVYDGDK